MSGSTNAPYWPLSSAYFTPASASGPCVVDLCVGVQQGNTPSCTTILGNCTAGSTTINAGLKGSTDVPCGYQSQSVTLNNGTASTIACELLAINGDTQVDVTGSVANIQISGANDAPPAQLNNVPVGSINSPVSSWPANAIDISDSNSLSQLAPILAGSTGGSSSASSGSSSSNGVSPSSVSSSGASPTLASTSGISSTGSTSTRSSTASTATVASASPTTSAKSNGLKSVDLPGLALVGALVAPMIFSMF